MTLEADVMAACLSVFGKTAASGDRGVFHRRHVEVDTGGEAPVSMLATTYTVPAGTVARGTVLTIDGANYRVRDIQQDGLGADVLILDARP